MPLSHFHQSPMAIVHHSQISFAHVASGMSYPMAILPYVIISHTCHNIFTLCPTPIRSHAHYAPCPSYATYYAPYPKSLCRLCPMPIIPCTHYAPYLLCLMQFMPLFVVLHAHYALCPLYLMPIMSHAHFASCP